LTYLVTGATGFVGGALVRRLRAAGHVVRAIVRTPAGAGDLQQLGIALYEGDVTDKASMRDAMSGVDGVFHVAGWYKIGVRDKRPATAVNVHGTRHVLELMGELGVPKGVYTSSLAVNSDTHGKLVDETYRFTGHHLSVYDESKARAHQAAESFVAAGLPLVIVQPGANYGPGDTSGIRTMLVQFLQRKFPAVPKQTTLAWGYIDDIAEGHVLAMEKGQPGRNYFLAGPPHTIEAALDLASEITDIPAPRIRLNPKVLRMTARLVAPIEKIVPMPPAYAAESLRIVAGVTYIGDNSRAKRELGWSVRPLREGLTETLRHEMRLLGMTPRF
jgi:nucleoside-diphosphate-sugar epimerase